MFSKIRVANVVLLVLLIGLLLLTAGPLEGLYAETSNLLAVDSWDDEVDTAFPGDSLQEYLGEDGLVDALIVLEEQADTAAVAGEVRLQQDYSDDDVAKAVVNSLQVTAEETQKPLIDRLEALAGVEVINEFFIVNIIHAKIPLELIDEIATYPEVDQVKPNRQVELIEPVESDETQNLSSEGVEWNIKQVNAPAVWDEGYDGDGVVVGIIDTGVDLEHEALLHKYRGYDQDGDHEHDYNWFDPHYQESAPDDEQGHGTHCIGTVLGSDQEGQNQVGVAPGAQWIAARGLDEDGQGTDAHLLAAGEYLLAPRPNPDGSGAPDPTRAPDIINSSWGGGMPRKDDFYQDIVENWRDAGIMPIFAAGNSGPGYGTVESPGNYPGSFAVAATDSINRLAMFSSRGASPYDHPGSMKPDLSAPGVNIRSAVPGNDYDLKQGTSMAAPHIAGVAALLLQADPDLEVDELENMIKNTAHPLTDDIYSESPNYGYGYGLVDALAALDGDKSPPPEPGEPDLFPDPLIDAAYLWGHAAGAPAIPAGNPHIPTGPLTLDLDGELGVLDYNAEIIMVGSDFIEETWYAIGYDNFEEAASLYSVDAMTGEPNKVGSTDIMETFTGLTYDPGKETLYASACYLDEENEQVQPQNELYTIDPETGEALFVTEIDGVDGIIFGIAFDNDGQLYGTEMLEGLQEDSKLYNLDPDSGEADLIGSMEVSWSSIFQSVIDGISQDIAFDHHNVLYGTLDHYYAENDYLDRSVNLYQIDTEQGRAEPASDDPVGVTGGLAIPALETDFAILRLSGNNRYETAVETALAEFPEGAENVIIARGDGPGDDPNVVDGLAGGYLAGVKDAPILLTRQDSLPDEIGNAIEELGANKAYILGGDVAVSEEVQTEIKDLDVESERIAGTNRFDTAAEIAGEGENPVDTAFIVNGFALADSMVAGAASVEEEYPILLVEDDSVPGDTAEAIANLGIDNIYIVGGDTVVSDQVKNELAGMVTGFVERLAGDDRYETSVEFAKELFAEPAEISVVNGREGLSDAVGACVFSNPVIYVGKEKIPSGVKDYLLDSLTEENVIRVFGGGAVVAGNVKNQLEKIISGEYTAVTGVSIVEGDRSITRGSTVQLTAEVEPDDATNQGVSWTSDDESIATVDADGLVTGESEGIATITVTTDDGGFEDTVEITVEVDEALEIEDGHWYGYMYDAYDPYPEVAFNVKDNVITKDGSPIEIEFEDGSTEFVSLIADFPHVIDGELVWWSFWTKEDLPITEENLFIIDEVGEDDHGNDHAVTVVGEFIKENDELFVDGFASHVSEDLNLKSEYYWLGLHEDNPLIEQAGQRQVPIDDARIVEINLAD